MTTTTLTRSYLTAIDSHGEMQSGIVYHEGKSPSVLFDEHLHIQKGSDGIWLLTIENCQWQSRDLAELEAHLREWAKDEYPDFPAPATHDAIIAEAF